MLISVPDLDKKSGQVIHKEKFYQSFCVGVQSVTLLPGKTRNCKCLKKCLGKYFETKMVYTCTLRKELGGLCRSHTILNHLRPFSSVLE